MSTKYVFKILGQPRFARGKWLLSVELEDFGSVYPRELEFDNAEQASSVRVGDRVLN